MEKMETGNLTTKSQNTRIQKSKYKRAPISTNRPAKIRKMITEGKTAKEIKVALNLKNYNQIKKIAAEMGVELIKYGLQHGTYTCYSNNRCRCDKCKQAARDHAQHHNRKNGRLEYVNCKKCNKRMRKGAGGKLLTNQGTEHNCKPHVAPNSKNIKHGTMGTYLNHKCRCDACMEVMRATSINRNRANGVLEYVPCPNCQTRVRKAADGKYLNNLSKEHQCKERSTVNTL